MKHLSKMTEAEMEAMTVHCETALMGFADAHGYSGLSHNGWFNFYGAIQDAIRVEWEKAKSDRKALARTKPRNVCGITKVWNDRVPVATAEQIGAMERSAQSAPGAANDICLECGAYGGRHFYYSENDHCSRIQPARGVAEHTEDETRPTK